ncbi:MAG: dihydropteroate synthase [Actinobacteria bacterium]|nr:dihydropteroate synthase [Actinomycetota bacterium]
MGVLNVTPDSFSDGGRHLAHDAAVRRGLALAASGADVVDVGGESTRPGADPVPADEELARVVPVIEALAPYVRISVDTRKAVVAEAAVAAGATLINDVSASLHEVAAREGVGFVAMHMLGDPRTMQRRPSYDDVVAEVRDFLVERAEAARRVGVDEVWIDPGIGFGKTVEHNLALLGAVGTLAGTGFPVLVGASRKRFLGVMLAEADGGSGVPRDQRDHQDHQDPVPVDDRLEGSVTSALWAIAQGAAMVRVHDVADTVAALRAVAA